MIKTKYLNLNSSFFLSLMMIKNKKKKKNKIKNLII